MQILIQTNIDTNTTVQVMYRHSIHTNSIHQLITKYGFFI